MKTWELKRGDVVKLNSGCSYIFLGMDGMYGKWCEVGTDDVFIGNYDNIEVDRNGKYYV